MSIHSCEVAGGTNYNGDLSICYFPPLSGVTGAPCNPPISPDGLPVVWQPDEGGCVSTGGCVSRPSGLWAIGEFFCEHYVGTVQSILVAALIAESVILLPAAAACIGPQFSACYAATITSGGVLIPAVSAAPGATNSVARSIDPQSLSYTGTAANHASSRPGRLLFPWGYSPWPSWKVRQKTARIPSFIRRSLRITLPDGHEKGASIRVWNLQTTVAEYFLDSGYLHVMQGHDRQDERTVVKEFCDGALLVLQENAVVGLWMHVDWGGAGPPRGLGSHLP